MKRQIKISTPSSRAKEPKGQESPYPIKPPRGFAALSPEQRRAIASMGGKASPVRGFSDPATAKKAGLRSGQVRKKELDSAPDAADKNE